MSMKIKETDKIKRIVLFKDFTNPKGKYRPIKAIELLISKTKRLRGYRILNSVDGETFGAGDWIR